MTFEDGMEWFDEKSAVPERPQDDLDTVAAAARASLYNLVRGVFNEEAARSGVTRKKLGDRLGVSSALVSRWLLKPSNMTIETAAKLLFIMGRELRVVTNKTDFRSFEYLPTLNWIEDEHANLQIVMGGAPLRRGGGVWAAQALHSVLLRSTFDFDCIVNDAYLKEVYKPVTKITHSKRLAYVPSTKVVNWEAGHA